MHFHRCGQVNAYASRRLNCVQRQHLLNNERGRLFYGGYGGPPEKIPHVFSYIFFFHGGEFVVGETGGLSLFSCSGGNQRVRGRRLLGGGGGRGESLFAP